EPEHPAVAAMTVDGRELPLPELHPATVLDVRHPAPGRLPLHVPLLAGHAGLRRPLLELHGVRARDARPVDELLRELHRAVVVDADLREHEHRLAGPDELATDAHDGSAHRISSLIKTAPARVPLGARGPAARRPARAGAGSTRRSRGTLR